MIRNSDSALKNAPATGLLKCLVTITVTPTVATPENAAPARFSVLPRATPASRFLPASAAGGRVGAAMALSGVASPPGEVAGGGTARVLAVRACPFAAA